jgi:hypothetical protein
LSHARGNSNERFSNPFLKPILLKPLTGKGGKATMMELGLDRGSLNSMKNASSILCWIMIALLPACVFAADSAAPSGAAMVRPYGVAWLNGTGVQHASAIFPGDLVQTGDRAALKIRASGSSVTVLSNSLVKFDGEAVGVEQGSVQMFTSKGMSAHAGIISATPASRAWTEFALTHANGMVTIMALKGDLQVSDGSQTTTVPQGQQATQKDSDETAQQPVPGAIPPATKRKKKAIIIWASAAGAAAAVGATAAVLASAGSPRVISAVAP